MSQMSVAVARTRKLPVELITGIRGLLSKLNSSSPLLPFIPKPIKVLFLLLILLNSSSFPFVWHIRVWWSALSAYLKVYRKGRTKYLQDWLKENTRAGGIAKIRTRVKRVVLPDDADYNLHLSNSCYAKNLDPVRMHFCISAFSPLFTPKGGFMGMGETHYVFIKEIPIWSEYVMETRCGGWDNKWVYLVTEFIIYPKSEGKGKGKGSSRIPASATRKPSPPSFPAVTSGIPNGTATPDNLESGASTPATMEGVKAASARDRELRRDGGVVCCLAITKYCFKTGRITIPPRVAMYLALQSPNKADRDHATDILVNHPDNGRAWLRGGWRDEPNAETLGNDIGLRDARVTNGTVDGSWIIKGREAMDKLNEGLAML